MRSREKLEIAMPGSSSLMPYAPQGVKGLDDDDDFSTEKLQIKHQPVNNFCYNENDPLLPVAKPVNNFITLKMVHCCYQ
jgi:hypothetical protein